MRGAGQRQPSGEKCLGGAAGSAAAAGSAPARRLRRSGKKVAEKRREPRRSGAKGSGRVDSPAVSSPPPPLLLFPKAGYHPSIFEEDPHALCQISCKQGYLAVAKTPRTVLLFGRAEDEQRQPLAGTASRISLKEETKVHSLDCEASCLLILTSNGKLLSRCSSASQETKTRLLKELTKKHIIQIACGDHHSMALSKGGELFAWGQNKHGQLGVERETGLITKPQLVQALEGIPLAKIAAGSAHSLAVSVFGTVYSWGKNMFGQLGLGDTADRYVPANVKALEHRKTAFISCGGEHTAVLSKDGLLSTFGAGCHGQLGHNSTRNELFPRIVAELFGAQVTQVACGRWHTLVYIPALGEVYSFGCGAKGQLGEGRESDQLVPLPLDLAVQGKNINYGSTSGKVVKIIAGDNQSIVLHLEEKNAYTDVTETLPTVEEEKVDKDPDYWKNIKQHSTLIFSSAACINGSFPQKRVESFQTSEEAVGVDMSAVLLFFQKIATKPEIFTKVIKALRRLLSYPPHSPTSPEALRFFLIVPVFLQKQHPNSDSLLSLLAKAIWNLPQKGKQALEVLWSNLEAYFFKDLVVMFQRLVGIKLSSFNDSYPWNSKKEAEYIMPLEVFQMLYEVNCKSDFKIQENNFYIPGIEKILTPPDLNYAYTEIQLMHRIRKKCRELLLAFFHLSKFPCIFKFEDKIVMHKVQCQIMHMRCILENPATNTLHIRRQHLLQDTWHYLRNVEENCFEQKFKVCFEGEPGIDDGALTQEFFTILSRQLCAPEVQIFKHFEESHCIWFSHEVSTQEDIYFLIGNLFGIAVQNLKIIALPFPLALFKKLANVEPTLEDLKALSPTVGRMLQVILDEPYDDILKNMMLDFMIMEERKGSLIEVDLKENGANIPVTLYNRKEYVDAYVNYIFNDSVRKQFRDFKHGFQRGCPSTTWQMFLPVELQVTLLGHTTYNWDELEKNFKYVGFEESDEIIKNFWTVFHDLPEENKKNFLAFLTGSDRIPAVRMENFSVTIADAEKENPDQWFPVAATCFQTLYLPRYTDKHILKKMFLVAIENFENFGLS